MQLNIPLLSCWIVGLCHVCMATFSRASLPALKLNWFRLPISMPLSLQLRSYHPSLPLQDGSLNRHCDITNIWCGLQFPNVTFCCCCCTFDKTETALHRYGGVCRHYIKHKKPKDRTVLCPWMWTDWCSRSHLLLIVQNSDHPSERELVITGLQGVFTEYCFREWLTPSCFVFARRETSEADRKDSGWELAAVVGDVYHAS